MTGGAGSGGEDRGLRADVLFAAMPVGDFATARSWYERFFGRPADVVAHDTEVMWQVADGGWLYIVGDAARAGHGVAALAVSDLDAILAGLAGRGVVAGPPEWQGDAGRKAVVTDPDGNSLSLLEVAPAG